MNLVEIEKMSSESRLQAMEALWDSLLHKKPEIESPQRHQEMISDRRKKTTDNTATLLNQLKGKNYA